MWRAGCNGITVYRYGTRPEQVLQRLPPTPCPLPTAAPQGGPAGLLTRSGLDVTRHPDTATCRFLVDRGPSALPRHPEGAQGRDR